MWVIILAMSRRKQKFKVIAPLKASRRMGKLSLSHGFTLQILLKIGCLKE